MTYLVRFLRFLRVSARSAFTFSISSRCLLMSNSEMRRMRTVQQPLDIRVGQLADQLPRNGLKPSYTAAITASLVLHCSICL